MTRITKSYENTSITCLLNIGGTDHKPAFCNSEFQQFNRIILTSPDMDVNPFKWEMGKDWKWGSSKLKFTYHIYIYIYILYINSLHLLCFSILFLTFQ